MNLRSIVSYKFPNVKRFTAHSRRLYYSIGLQRVLQTLLGRKSMKLHFAMLGLLITLVGGTALTDEPDPRTVAPTITEACALSDLDLVVAIEVGGNVNPTSPYLVFASDLLYSAREECYGEHEAKALQLYEAGIQMLRQHNVSRAK